MVEGPIEQDQVFVHTRTQREFIVLNGQTDEMHTVAKMGSSTLVGNGPGEGWQSAVVYYDPTETHKMFVRDEVNFRANFERV